MRLPKGIDLAGGLIVSVVLFPPIVLTGRLLGDFETRHHHECGNVTPEVLVDEEEEFILLQLTTAFGAVFPVGTVVAVNVDQILAIGASATTA